MKLYLLTSKPWKGILFYQSLVLSHLIVLNLNFRCIIEEDAEGEETQEGGGGDSPDAARRDSQRYSLSGIEGIDLDMDDSSVLTSESWQREKNHFPEHLQ